MRVLCFLRLSDLQGQSLTPSVQIQKYSQINKKIKKQKLTFSDPDVPKTDSNIDNVGDEDILDVYR